MSGTEKLICGDCKSKFEVETGKRGSLRWTGFANPVQTFISCLKIELNVRTGLQIPFGD
jgi:hypothetical protein